MRASAPPAGPCRAAAGRVSVARPARRPAFRSAFSQTETAFALIRARVSAFMKAPPPVASTCGGSSSSRRDHPRARRRGTSASPSSAKMSEIDRPAAASISSSASRNGRPSALASRRPTRRLADAHQADEGDGAVGAESRRPAHARLGGRRSIGRERDTAGMIASASTPSAPLASAKRIRRDERAAGRGLSGDDGGRARRLAQHPDRLCAATWPTPRRSLRRAAA